ncbi:cupin domain-containing protein [Nostoc sp.]|uniref:cupin domain-containing protein n=1 Tax=Nostoc sp. TaxID=1180 RepID=UPI002FF456D1
MTAGTGWVQQESGEKQEIRQGDVVWTPPGVKHWHGATATDRLTHIAIQETLEGKNVEWMEKVSDEALTRIEVEGDRYPEELEKRTGL